MASFAKEMVALLEDFLKSNQPGINTVTSDGTTVSYNRAQALAELDHWKRKAAKESGRGGLFRGVDIGGAW